MKEAEEYCKRKQMVTPFTNTIPAVAFGGAYIRTTPELDQANAFFSTMTKNMREAISLQSYFKEKPTLLLNALI